MTFGLPAARRLAFTIAALLVVTASPMTSAAADSQGPFAVLGHGWMTVDTNLRGPSHVSAWSIDEYLTRATPLPPLGHAFKQAEAKYDVNALYLLAHAMHETAFGTSYIAQRFHNLFGWHAYDRNPTGFATRFPTYAAGIDSIAGQISDQFLTPGGKYYGGAATLRGMHHYASDPMWGPLIARIANGIVLSTLARRGIVFQAPVVGDASTGRTTTVDVTTREGDLPNGLHAAYRFVPVAIVEAGAPTGPLPAADPPFLPATGTSRADALHLTVTAPTRAGRYRLEVQLRDSDATQLTEYAVPEIPDTAVRVFGSDAVAYDLEQDQDSLAVTVTNEGRREIPATSSVPGLAGAPATTVPTSLTAWLVAADGTPSLLGTAALDRALAPDDTWTARLPLPDPATLPAILVVRLDVGGAPGRLGGSPPGVFRLAADGISLAGPAGAAGASGPAGAAGPGGATGPTGSATPTPTPSPSTSPDPSAPASDPSRAAGTSAAGNGSPAGDGSSVAVPPITLTIGALTPIDPATRSLLNPGWNPLTVIPKVKPSASTPAGGSTTHASSTGSVRLSYLAVVDPEQPGWTTIRITNRGTAPLIAAADPTGDPTATEPALSSNGASSPADPTATPSDPADPTDDVTDPSTGAVLRITAVPAWGPASDPIVMTIPLIDIGPGISVDVHAALPPATMGPSTYLLIARVLPAGGGSPYPATLLWLRSAAPAAAAEAATAPPALFTLTTVTPAGTPGSAATLAPTATPGPRPASATQPAEMPAPAAAPTPTPIPKPTPTPTPTPTPAATPRPAVTASPSVSPTPSDAASRRFGSNVVVPGSNR